jgi:hypothetical protein
MESAWEERGHWHQQNQPFSRPTFLGLLQLAWFLRATARPPSMQPKKESSRLLEAAGMVVGSDRFTRRLLEYGLFRHYILYKQVLDKQSRFANWKSADAKGVQFCCFGWPPKKIVHFLNFAGFSQYFAKLQKNAVWIFPPFYLAWVSFPTTSVYLFVHCFSGVIQNNRIEHL